MTTATHRADLARQVADRTADTRRASRYAFLAVLLSFAGNAAHFAAEMFDMTAVEAAATIRLASEHVAGPVVVLVATHLLLHTVTGTVESRALWVGVLAGFALSAIHLHGLAQDALGDQVAVLLPLAVEAASIGSILQYVRNRDHLESLTQDLAHTADENETGAADAAPAQPMEPGSAATRPTPVPSVPTMVALAAVPEPGPADPPWLNEALARSNDGESHEAIAALFKEEGREHQPSKSTIGRAIRTHLADTNGHHQEAVV